MPERPIRKLIFLTLLWLLLQEAGYSQLCTGSLGEPVYTFNFDYRFGIPPGLTDYEYADVACPKEGQYATIERTFLCFDGTWHTISGDHTPGINIGYSMIVNSAVTQVDIFRETIPNLCVGSVYELSVWVLNMQKPGNNCVDPNLTFRVETLSGTLISEGTSGYIAKTNSPMWKQVGITFQLPKNADAVKLRIWNNSPGGCGSDLALDDIALRKCGPEVSASLAATGNSEITLCSSDTRSLLLNAQIGPGLNNAGLQWQKSTDLRYWENISGATGPTYLRTPTGEGTYFYRLVINENNDPGVSSNCLLYSNNISIIISPPLFVSLTNYVNGCYGSTVRLDASGGTTFHWTGPNGFSSNDQRPLIPNVKFSDSGIYTVTVSSGPGCEASRSTNLQIFPAVNAKISPNMNICEGESVQLTASGGDSYAWDPAPGLNDFYVPDPIVTPSDSTRYFVTIVNNSNPAHCFDTASVFVNVWKKPVANAGPDRRMLINRPTRLKGSAGGTDISYTWSPLNYMEQTNSLQPAVNPPKDITYTLEVRSNRGCGVSEDTVMVRVFESIPVPNTFTPNGDGINDRWEIDLLDIFEDAVVEVYNTAGQLVYRSIGYNKPWDGTQNGKALPVGTYYYAINLKVPSTPYLTGYVTILR